MFKIGDLVKIKNSFDPNFKGKIIDIVFDYNSIGDVVTKYTVELEDKTLISPTLIYEEQELELIEPINKTNEVKCECGIDSIKDSGGRHSSYCPKFDPEQYK